MKDQLWAWFTNIVRTEIYTPAAVLKLIDTKTSCNLEALEGFRELQTKGKKYFCNSLLPCSADVKREAAAMNAYADAFLPAEYGSHDDQHDFV